MNYWFKLRILEFYSIIHLLCSVFSEHTLTEVSVFNAKGPPVPIPNTEVKLCSAENTCLETDREDRSTLTLFQAKLEKART